MKKFIAIYMSSREEIDKFMSRAPEDRQKDMKGMMGEWEAWHKAHSKNVTDLGNPFGKTKKITSGGVSETKNELTGYSFVNADDYNAAVKLFEGHPHLKFPGASIEIMECLPM